jgi:hypothetical protein
MAFLFVEPSYSYRSQTSNIRLPYLFELDRMEVTNLSPFDTITLLSIMLTIIVVLLFYVQPSIIVARHKKSLTLFSVVLLDHV